ncbi:hypothetical protein EBU95_05385 [bacterium]|nr:hypothetical protein [bacterium]
MNPKYKKRVIHVCRRYYNAMKTYGEPPNEFTRSDYDIIDEVCDLIRNKFKKRLPDDLSTQQAKYLEIFTPELYSSARY